MKKTILILLIPLLLLVLLPASPGSRAADGEAVPSPHPVPLGALPLAASEPSPPVTPAPGPVLALPPGPLHPAHYHAERYERYEAYITAYPELAWESAVALVNIGADLPFYTDVQTIAEPDAPEVLCNKLYSLPKDYVPDDLRQALGSHQMLGADAADALEAMAAEMKALGLPLVLRSGYRSYAVQATIFSKQTAQRGRSMALKYYAKAGHSEHQTGLAADLLHKNTSGTMGSAGFEKTEQYRWLLDNAHRYGYILRYPKGAAHITGYNYEPWHWRYIGAEAAADMHERGIATYEEYCGWFR